MMDRMTDPTAGGGQPQRPPAELYPASEAARSYRPRYEPQPHREATIDLRNVGRAVLRRWWIVVPLVAAAAFAGYQASSALPTMHKASSTLMIGQSTDDPSTDLDAIRASQEIAFTYADLATRQPTLMAVVNALELDMTWQALSKQVRVKRVADTPLIEVSVEAETPELAEKIAKELTDRIVALSPTASAFESQSFLQQRAATLRTEIAATQATLERNRERRDEATTTATRDIYERRVAAGEKRLLELEHTHSGVLDDLRSERSPNTVSIFQEPKANTSALEPNRIMNGILAAGVGLLLALAIAMVLEARQRHSLVRARFRA